MRKSTGSYRSLTVRLLALALLCVPAMAQTAETAGTSSQVVPQWSRFEGAAQSRASDTVEMVFRIYAAPEGGEALWSETQRVAVGADGRYAVVLGAASQAGLPQAVFAGGQARWMGVSIERAPEQARVPFTSVAYAMKAGDAETLGGVPSAEFVTQNQLRASGIAPPGAGSASSPVAGKVSSDIRSKHAVTGAGAANTIPLWTDSAGTLGNSALAQSGLDLNAAGAFTAQTAYATDYSAAVNGNENSATGIVFGVSGYAASTTSNAAGVSGYEGATTGSVYGVMGGTASTTDTAAGVKGYETAGTGSTRGVFGLASSITNGASGVLGFENGATGQVWGMSGNAMSSGVSGATMSAGGAAGVNGWEGAATGPVAGVRGSTGSTGATSAGTYGWEYATTGQVYGLSGQADSTGAGAAGVYGNETATTGSTAGVMGVAASNSGVGVLGETTAAGATAGEFVNAAGSGLILAGLSNSTKVFSVDSSGNGTFAGNLTVNGSPLNAAYAQLGAPNTFTSGNIFTKPITFAAGQTFPGAGGGGTITGVTATSPLTGGGTSGAVTVGLNTATLETTLNGVYAQLGAANTFTKPIKFAAGQAFPGAGTITGVTASGPLTGGGASGAVTVGLNTAALETTLNSVYAQLGAANAFTKPMVFAAGQTFPGAGTITGVTASGPLTGGGTSGAVTVGLNTATLETTLNSVYPRLGAANTFAGNQTITGNLNVTGKITKGSGSFKIDDPLEPEKKYLSHSFVESPDMMNVYNGNIVTDKHGVATVVLPDYFEALNRDFRYQLTVIGQFAQAIVAREIEKNHFVIRTSKPGVKVSWQITGIRQDAYANANRIPVEEEKPAEEQGYYLHPEAFGQPASKSIAAAHQAPASSNEVQLSQR